jgi:hypothetical protein
MPALGFKSRFARLIRNGKKPFTLRDLRKDGRDPKAGQILYFYTGMRTKLCRQIRAPGDCLWAREIYLLYGLIQVEGWPIIILPYHLDRFARLDGFKDYAAFCQFHGIRDGMTKRFMRIISWERERKVQRRIFEKRFLDVWICQPGGSR